MSFIQLSKQGIQYFYRTEERENGVRRSRLRIKEVTTGDDANFVCKNRDDVYFDKDGIQLIVNEPGRGMLQEIILSLNSLQWKVLVNYDAIWWVFWN